MNRWVAALAVSLAAHGAVFLAVARSLPAAPPPAAGAPDAGAEVPLLPRPLPERLRAERARIDSGFDELVARYGRERLGTHLTARERLDAAFPRLLPDPQRHGELEQLVESASDELASARAALADGGAPQR